VIPAGFIPPLANKLPAKRKLKLKLKDTGPLPCRSNYNRPSGDFESDLAAEVRGSLTHEKAGVCATNAAKQSKR